MRPVFVIGGVVVVAAGVLLVSSKAKAEVAVSPGAAPLKNTRGFRNHNPTNLRYVKTISWLGQVGSDPDGYAVFTDDEKGVRAGMINLHTKFVRDRLTTTRKLIKSWAPAIENPTEAYTVFMAKRLNVSADQELSWPVHGVALTRGIVAFENGGDPLSADFYERVKASAGL